MLAPQVTPNTKNMIDDATAYKKERTRERARKMG
jgi:hypothetical protein